MWRWLAAIGGVLFGSLPPEAASMLASWPSSDGGEPPADPCPRVAPRSPGKRRKRPGRRFGRTKRHRG
jgi:hypothetical protein